MSAKKQKQGTEEPRKTKSSELNAQGSEGASESGILDSEETEAQELEKLEKLSIEESFELLDSLVEKLEDENLSLEGSFEAFEEGMKLLKAANSKLDLVEKKVRVINEEGGLDDFQ